MNPILSAALGAVLRWALAGAAMFFVDHGIWTAGEASSYVLAGSLAILSLGWSLWNKYHGRVKFLTALAMPKGTTEDDVKSLVAAGASTAVTTPSDTAPKLGI